MPEWNNQLRKQEYFTFNPSTLTNDPNKAPDKHQDLKTFDNPNVRK